jgi:pimeloyl-ACP methyl ester carboxylesterase
MAVDTLPCICAAMGRKTDAESLKQQSERTEKRLVEMSRDAFLKDQKGFFGGWFTDKDKLEKVYSWISASDQATVARAMGEFMGGDLRTELGRIKSPILCVIAYDKDLEQSGMKQSDLEKECTEQIAKAPHHKLVVTADAKHFIMYDQPKWLWEQMDEFLKEAGK